MVFQTISSLQDNGDFDTKDRKPNRYIVNSLIMFVLYILISSEIFIDSILSIFSGTTLNGNPTVVGVAIQAFALVLLYSLITYIA